MKKIFTYVVITLLLLGCNKPKEEPVLELISYYWAMYDDYRKLDSGEWGDTTIQYVRCDIYAQIYRNGECSVFQNRGEYANELYATVKLDKAILNPILGIISSVNKDTLMVEQSEPGSFIYDGPLIKLIGKNTKGEKHTIAFIHSRKSNESLRIFYKHIVAVCSKTQSNDKLIQAKEKRIKEIYDTDFPSIPKIIKDTIVFKEPKIGK